MGLLDKLISNCGKTQCNESFIEKHVGDLYEKYGLPKDWCPKNNVPISKKIYIIREDRTKKK